MGEVFTKEYTVGFQQADCFGNLSPGVLQAFLMDAATCHSDILGVSRDDLPGRAVWVIIRARVTLTRPIPYRSRLQVVTWYRGASGVQLFRDFDLMTDNTKVGEAVTAWLMYDQTGNRILRPGEFNQDDCIYIPDPPRTVTLPKLTAPEGQTMAGVHTVGYTDLDVNGHMNNARYVELGCDALELDTAKPVFFPSFAIQYTKQALPGETLTLYKAQQPDGGVFIRGQDQAGTAKFSAVVHTRPIP